MKRDTRQAYRRRAADTERMVDQSVAEIKAAHAADFQAQKERAAYQQFARNILPAVEAHLLAPGMWVLDRRNRAAVVIRVNQKTARVDLGGGHEGRPGVEASWPLHSIIAAAHRPDKEASA